MGLFDLFAKRDVDATRSALDEAERGGESDAATSLLARILDLGIDGAGPYESAEEVARKALDASSGNRSDAIDRVIGQHLIGGAVGGFVTGLGGFFTLILAIPANLFSFYVQATRMTAAVAWLRGYDLADPRIRTAVLLSEVGSNAHDILAKAGIPSAGANAVSMLSQSIPRSVMMMIQKGIGFRMLRTVGISAFGRLGRLVPVAGGLIGGGVDYMMMRTIAEHAKGEFPVQV